MIHILVIARNNIEKNSFVSRVRSALNTICSIEPGLTSHVRVKDIDIQVTYPSSKTGEPMGEVTMVPDYYVKDSEVKVSQFVDMILKGGERLRGVKDVVEVANKRQHYAKHESYNRI